MSNPALFIFATDEAQQKAGYEFIKFLSSKEGQTIWVLDTGYRILAPREGCSRWS